ncbi:MAG: hypothetical protein EP319_10800 [Deltaproteobacteria bacterium]|nr:MAG: hypothetical protein EP319_10800 [Deltaproteobacteria bacterium]
MRNKIIPILFTVLIITVGCKDDPPPCLTSLCDGYVHMLPPSGSDLDGRITNDGFGTLPPEVRCEVKNGKPSLPSNLEEVARQMTECKPFKDNSVCACKDICPMSSEILSPISGQLEYSKANVPSLESTIPNASFNLGKLGFIKKMNNFASFQKDGEKPSAQELQGLLKNIMNGEIAKIPGFESLDELVSHQDYKDVLLEVIRAEQSFRINTLSSMDAYDEFTSEKERNEFLFSNAIKHLNKKQRPIVTFPHPTTLEAQAYLATETKNENGEKVMCLHDPSESFENNRDCKIKLSMKNDGSMLLKTPSKPQGRAISQAGIIENQEMDMERMGPLQNAGISPQEDADWLLAIHAHSKQCRSTMVACSEKSLDENFDRLFPGQPNEAITLSANSSDGPIKVQVEGPKDQVQAIQAILGNDISPITLTRISACSKPATPICVLEKTFGSVKDAKRAMVVWKETGFAPEIVEPASRSIASTDAPPLPSSGIQSHRKNTDVGQLKKGSGEEANSSATGLFRKPITVDGKLTYQTCTATIVSPSVVLTSSACLNDKPDATGAHVIFNSQKGMPMTKRIKVNCSRVLSMDTQNHMVLLQCDGRPGDHFGVTEFASSPPSSGDEVYSIHHPTKKEKSYTTGKIQKVNPGASIIRSDLLTEVGSGGSMIFSRKDHKALGMNFGSSENKKESFSVDAATINKFITENSPGLELGRRYPASFNQ